MNINDEEFFEALKNVFSILPTLFISEVFMSITDKERFIYLKQPKNFKLNISEGMPIVKGGVSEGAIRTGQRQSLHYPKETFRFPIVAYAVPIMNPHTSNIVGTITYGISLEKETEMNEMADELQAFSEELAASSEELAASTQELSLSSQSINSLVYETQNSISSMDDIILYVKKIADTTNLLGLNAAIEAARAGEYGRGFNVVAGEIRKLAANSKDSTGRISQVLEEIKQNVNSIVGVLKGFSATSETQAAQAEQIAAGSQRLSELSSSLLNLSEEINE